MVCLAAFHAIALDSGKRIGARRCQSVRKVIWLLLFEAGLLVW